MSVDSYAPCPCGSGEKYKWCCQKIEAYAEKVSRLLEHDQFEAALAAAEEGLRKVPGNLWLELRRATTLIELDRRSEARRHLEAVVKAHPESESAWGLMAYVVRLEEGIEAAVAVVQRALGGLPAEKRGRAKRAAFLTGSALVESARVPAAIKHLELVDSLDTEGHLSERVDQVLGTLRRSPVLSPWIRSTPHLSAPPAGLSSDAAARFREAVDLATSGLWSQAAAIFQTLAAADDRPEINRNLGLCRLWLADEPAAIEALRRAAKALGETTEAVDIEGLCQAIEPTPEDAVVERVRLTWTLRDRQALLSALRASPMVSEDQDDGESPRDEQDPDGELVFELLDRPRPTEGLPASILDLPAVVGEVLVGTNEVSLDVDDDGDLDRLTSQFADLAGATIPPAQPRTQSIAKTPRAALAMRPVRWIPPGTPIGEMQRLLMEERNWRAAHVWPETPAPYLRGRTPRQAAAAGDAAVALRAAILTLEFSSAVVRPDASHLDFHEVRTSLNVPAEPEVDPAADIEALPLARLPLVPVQRLDDARLAALYHRVVDSQLPALVQRVALEVIERPSLLADPSIGPIEPFAQLATLALPSVEDGEEGRGAKALEWINRGRAADPNASTLAQSMRWDIVELRIRAATEPMENWVPLLAVQLERSRQAEQSDPALLSLLVELGLIQLTPHPELPGEFLMDTRRLQAVMANFGPRITTAEGSLGVAATRGGIWTPEAETGGSTTPGGIWTPGGSDSSGGEKKLIIPGR